MKMNVIFNPYCNFAIIGFSEMKLFACVSRFYSRSRARVRLMVDWSEGSYVNIFLRRVKGRGTMRSMKRAISATRSRKTRV